MTDGLRLDVGADNVQDSLRGITTRGHVTRREGALLATVEALLRVPPFRRAWRLYEKARGRAACIAAILHGDAVIFGATVTGGAVTAGNTWANVGIGDLTVAESTIEECTLTATHVSIEFGSKIGYNYLSEPG